MSTELLTNLLINKWSKILFNPKLMYYFTDYINNFSVKLIIEVLSMHTNGHSVDYSLCAAVKTMFQWFDTNPQKQDFAESYTPTMRSSDLFIKFSKFLKCDKNMLIYTIQISNDFNAEDMIYLQDILTKMPAKDLFRV